MPLPPGKDEWQMPYPSGTENWQIPHPISGGTLGDSLDTSIIEMKKWTEYCVSRAHPYLHLAKACIDNTPPQQFWSLTDQYPDLVRHLRVEVRLIVNLGFNAEVPWLSDMDCLKCFICKCRSLLFLIACPIEKTSLFHGLTPKLHFPLQTL